MKEAQERRRPQESGGARPGAAADGRAEVLAAAAQVFMERGYAATAIDDVADMLGSTKGRIYHYYRSKADLFLDVHAQAMQDLLEHVGPIAARSGLTPLERLRAMAKEHARIIMTTFAFQKAAVQGLERRLLSLSNTRQHREMRRIIEMRDTYEDLYAAVVEDGIGQGLFVRLPPRMATKPILGAVNWLNVWFEPGRAATPQQVEDIAVLLSDFVLRGMLPEGPARRR